MSARPGELDGDVTDDVLLALEPSLHLAARVASARARHATPEHAERLAEIAALADDLANAITDYWAACACAEHRAPDHEPEDPDDFDDLTPFRP